MIRPVRVAVVPAAGLGTRFLPFSRSLPKELLPLVDTPVIDFVVSEAASAGCERVVIVGAAGKDALEAYFRPSRMADRLAAEGRTAELAALRRPEGLADLRFVRQEEPRGNGHAVLCAREAVGDEPFLMLWGDDVVVGDPPAAVQLVRARERLGGGSVAAVIRVPAAEASRYGVVDGSPADGAIRVRAIVEKPPPGKAPSELAAVHGYVLEPEIFDVLASQAPGRGGEIWLTDAVTTLAGRAPVWAVELTGRRYDAGDRTGYVAAFVDAALDRPDTGPALRDHLRKRGWHEPGVR